MKIRQLSRILNKFQQLLHLAVNVAETSCEFGENHDQRGDTYFL